MLSCSQKINGLLGLLLCCAPLVGRSEGVSVFAYSSPIVLPFALCAAICLFVSLHLRRRFGLGRICFQSRMDQTPQGVRQKCLRCVFEIPFASKTWFCGCAGTLRWTCFNEGRNPSWEESGILVEMENSFEAVLLPVDARAIIIIWMRITISDMVVVRFALLSYPSSW